MSDLLPLRRGDVFFAEGTLLCRVEKVRAGVAFCEVVNGFWDIGFDAATGLSVEKGTDRPALPHCLGLRVLVKGPFAGRDYNEQISSALALLAASPAARETGRTRNV